MASFPERVLLLTISVPVLEIPPPLSREELPEIVLLLMVSVPSLSIPPPVLSVMVLLMTLSTPLLAMPPPKTAKLPERLLSMTVSGFVKMQRR